MKKIYTLSLLLIFTACLFTGCIIAPDDFSNNSNIKYKAWKQTEGYMVKEEGSEERHFVAWSSSIQDKSHQATMYEHEYIKVKGMIGKPAIARSNRAGQIFFVNDRYIAICEFLIIQETISLRVAITR